MDFDKLLRETNQSAPIEPRELYASLPEKADGYGYLRDVQGQVLTSWHKRRDARDLVLKVNTGAGKTIDGLVILRSHLNAGNGPALYVAPNKYLVQQVIEEAARIGVATVDDPDHPRYLSGEAIAVVNIWKLFNGKSVFRESRPTMLPAPIGSVVIDDAHAALPTARESLSIRLPETHPAYAELLALFAEDLKEQAPNALLDVEEQAFSALARVPFRGWRAKIDSARKILHKYRNTDELKFSWPAVSDVLHISRAIFTGRELTVTPLCSPVGSISNFRDAKHRIYLTATLADDSVLVTDFGADASSVADPITPTTAGDIGERMIIAPLELNPDLAVEAVRNSIKKLSKQHNAVVIVPSDRVAKQWATYAEHIIYADDVAAIVQRLRNGHVGLVVLVNKYDGIDLPGKACRILVLDGLPEAFSGEDRVESQLMSRTAGTDDRQVQRIEQGMGRGVRSNEDHCVVFLLGPRLTQLVADPRTFSRFGPATRAQLEQSRMMSNDLESAPLSSIIDVARQALDRDPDWVRFAKSALAAVQPSEGHVSASASARREAFDKAAMGDYVAAARELSAAVNVSTDDREQGWLLEQEATYVDQLDPEQAQKILASARKKNPSVLRPLTGVTHKRLSASHNQSKAASDFLTARYSEPIGLRVGFEAMLDGLVFDPDETDRFEQAFSDLGEHLGFGAARPEHELGQGPDVLWALGDLRYWVVEAKSGATTKYISKHDANQLNGSVLWFGKTYDKTVKAQPVLIHPSVTLGKDASATSGMSIINEQALDRLRGAVRDFSAALAADRWDDHDTVDRLLAGHKLRSGNLATYLRAVKTS